MNALFKGSRIRRRRAKSDRRPILITLTSPNAQNAPNPGSTSKKMIFCLVIFAVAVGLYLISHFSHHFITIQLPHLIDNVVILDVLWVPNEFRIIITSLTANHFKENPLPSSYNVQHESIQHPCSLNILINGAAAKQCDKIKTHSGDNNVDYTLDIASFPIPFEQISESSMLNVQVVSANEVVTIATLTQQKSDLNALSSFNFRRELDPSTSSISVCIKLVYDYSPFILDIINVCAFIFLFLSFFLHFILPCSVLRRSKFFAHLHWSATKRQSKFSWQYFASSVKAHCK